MKEEVPVRCEVFVDESIHVSSGFILTAIVVTTKNVDDAVRRALIESGLSPLVDEYKSSHLKVGDEKAHKLRKALKDIFHTHDCRVALVICSVAERPTIGTAIRDLLVDIKQRGRIPAVATTIYADEGLFRARDKIEIEQCVASVSQITDSKSRSWKLLNL
jgi:hypothetical protein